MLILINQMFAITITISGHSTQIFTLFPRLSKFLGQISLPLNEMDQFERPRARWFKLQSKPGHDKKDKDRGELEIKISFTVKAGSLSDLSKKEKQKASMSSGVGGSLLSLGSAEKRKSLAKFAKSLGSKMHVTGKKKKDKNSDSDSFSGSFSSLGTPSMGLRNSTRSSGIGHSNADPGVISEDEDEFVFDNLSHKSSANSLSKSKSKFSNLILTEDNNASETASISSSKKAVESPLATPRETPQKPTPTPRETPQKVDEWEAKLYGKALDQPLGHTTDSLKRRSLEKTRVPLNNESSKKEKNTNPFDEASMDRISLSSDIPSNITTPTKSSKDDDHLDPDNVQLERSISEFETSENVNEKELKSSNSSPSLKERQDNIFSKKWRNFKRELAPSKPDVQLRNQYNKSQNRVSEKIVEGREFKSEILFKEKKREELPLEITTKYEGKTKEVRRKLIHEIE